MQRLEVLRGKIESAKELHSIIKTMKALAAVNLRQYEQGVDALKHYTQTIEMGLQIVLQNREIDMAVTDYVERGRLGVVIFGAEQGLAGQFNARIVAFALDRVASFHYRSEQSRRVLVVGTRAIPHLEEAGQPVTDQMIPPSSPEGIIPKVRQMLLRLETWRTEFDVERIVIFHNTPTGSASYEPTIRWFLPIAPGWLHRIRRERWKSSILPTFTMDWEPLFASLIRQYFFVILYGAFVKSLASENASRLASMEAADQNIEERLNRLNALHHRHRQTSITEELLDIVAGFEALAG
jgi:F-type H+-transporting ATPase subunit gamma